jgi:excisionase family DNA binding protein
VPHAPRNAPSIAALYHLEEPMPPALARIDRHADTTRVLLTVEEAAARLGIGRTTMFALVRRGDVASVQIGRLRRVRAIALDAYVDRLTATPAA